MKMYGYWRSAASWRVRIALHLKGVDYQGHAVNLAQGAQFAPDLIALNRQALVPVLMLDDGTVLTQSLAIIEWLDETYPSPALLPRDAAARARVRALAYTIACDTHPVQNLRVLKAVRALGGSEEVGTVWAARVNAEGLAACEAMLATQPGHFAHGETPTLADICIIPQLGNARRFGADVTAFPRLLALEAACLDLPAFATTAPGLQPDAPPAR